MKRILIGSCGGLTGSYLTRCFKDLGCYVIGADASERHVTKFFADEAVCLPTAAAEDFCEQLVKILCEKQVDYYIPTHSKEIKKVAEKEEWIRDHWQGDFMVSPYETFLKLNDKQQANDALKLANIPVPNMFKSVDEITQYPVFMKPDEGSGSQRARKIETALLCQEYARLEPGSSFYEYITGTEYTVDCMFDNQGALIGYNQRVRVKSMGGAVIISQNDYTFDILPYLKRLESAFVFKGCVNFQYILSNGIPYFIDVNLRYASGGLPLTVASGVNVPQIMLDIWQNKKIQDVRSCAADRKIMYRYFNEWFEDAEV